MKVRLAWKEEEEGWEVSVDDKVIHKGLDIAMAIDEEQGMQIPMFYDPVGGKAIGGPMNEEGDWEGREDVRVLLSSIALAMTTTVPNMVMPKTITVEIEGELVDPEDDDEPRIVVPERGIVLPD